RTVFGIAEPGPLRALLQRSLGMLDNPLYILEYAQKDLGPFSPWGRYLRLRSEIQRALMSHIAASRRDPKLESRHDILSMLLLARDEDGEPLADDEVHDELITMLIAGHETTATALSWTMHRLTRHPDVLRRAVAEIDATGNDTTAPLPYLDAVIRESLRIHPVVPGVGRVLEKPFTLGGYELPPGIMIGCSIILAHTNENVWPDAESFKPERFLDHRPPPDAYFPFGGGVRRCIGEAFALFEMRVVLREILRTFTPEASGETIRSVRRNITLSPSGAMPVVFRRR
ncbi:MAG: cytochrome P450, partial [Polyangiales bacterium]